MIVMISWLTGYSIYIYMVTYGSVTFTDTFDTQVYFSPEFCLQAVSSSHKQDRLSESHSSGQENLWSRWLLPCSRTTHTSSQPGRQKNRRTVDTPHTSPLTPGCPPSSGGETYPAATESRSWVRSSGHIHWYKLLSNTMYFITPRSQDACSGHKQIFRSGLLF